MDAARIMSSDELNRFEELGYVVFPGFLPADLVARLKPETDRWVDQGHRERSIASAVDPATHGVPSLLELELPAHGELLAHPPLMDLLAQLMGPRFVFHHMHSDRQAPQLPGKAWHHDYEQNPQVDRAFRMVHALHYLDGLDSRTAALVVLPGSHHEVAEKDARAVAGEDPLPGEVVIDELPPGSTVVLHSALFHARRARPGGNGRDRYFLDVSYCEVGPAWPPVKPYWRHMVRRGRELNLDGGRWPELFAEEHFAEFAKPGR